MITRRSFLVGAGGTALAATALARTAYAKTRSGVNWTQLSDNLTGRLVLPSDADYPTAKELYILDFDSINPQAIAYCASAADVALCLGFAQDNAMPIAARSGGHSAGGYSTTPGLVIDVSGLNSIVLGNGTATMGPGAELVDITNALAPAGLALPGGYCPTVAAGGFLQGGGIGLLTHGLGVACDLVTSAQVVLADGSVVTASAMEHSDLFWALRGGGGGNFGVVTSYTFTPSSLPFLGAAFLTWTYDQALDALDGWTQWLAGVPQTITGSGLKVTLADSAPGNVPVVSVVLGSSDTGTGFSTEVARLTSLIGHAPASQQVLAAPLAPIMMNLYGCGSITLPQCHVSGAFTPQGELPRAAFGYERGRMFSQAMPRDGWSRALAVLDGQRVAGQMHQLQVTALGGAANSVPRTATAYVHRDSTFMVNYLAENAVPPVSREARIAAGQFVDIGFDVIDPYSNGETYQNFIDPRLQDWQHSYYAENYQRLTQVKAAYDPYHVFRFAQGIR